MKQNPKSPIQFKTITPRFLIVVALVLGYFALSPVPNAFGVVPAPDGGYPNANTAEGADALFNLTSGIDNNALGFQALYFNTTGNFNTAEGYRSLYHNTTGGNNTATGVQALFSNAVGIDNTALGVNTLYRNTTGNFNTATGWQALFNNSIGANNTATGVQALFSNTTGIDNTALGVNALYRNTTGSENTAAGAQALFSNTTGDYNTALGLSALYHNTYGHENTATGWQALANNQGGYQNTANGYEALLNNSYGFDNTATGTNALHGNQVGSYNTANGYGALSGNKGSNNIALGYLAGANLTTGNHNICIGSAGLGAESSTIRIGDVQTATYIKGISGKTATGGAAVFVTSNGKLGTVTSSRRFKKDIVDMNAASDALLALRPVTFRYKPELDKAGIPQYGLVAEEVAEVNPDLVVRDEKGEIYTVRYEAVNAMLLNEFLKEHRRVEELKSTAVKQEATITDLKTTVVKQEALIAQQQQDFQSVIARQQREMQALAANLREQDSKIQKVSVQLAAASPSLGGPTQQVVKNP